MGPLLTDDQPLLKQRRKFIIEILGRQYSIKADGNESYVQQLADYINAKTKEVMNSSHTISTLDVAIKTAIKIADDLFQERQEKERLKKELKEESKKLLDEIQAHLGENTGGVR